MTTIPRSVDDEADASPLQVPGDATDRMAESATESTTGSPHQALQAPLESTAASVSGRAAGSVETHTIPVVEERLQLDTRLTDTGRGVRIHKSVIETPHTVDQPLLRDELQVQRFPQDRVLEPGQVPQTRYEGDTLVIPVVEEVLVLQKQLRLTEEIRITRVRTPVMSTQTVMLKTERVELERFDQPGARSDDGLPLQ